MRQVPSIAMGFTLQLQQDLVEVEAGGNSPVTIIVSNRGETSDRFELAIEGLDLDWTAIPLPVFAVEPGETRTERAFFKPPRASESSAGNYPFVVTVRSLSSGDVKTVQGVLRLKPFHALSLEINPKKGVYSWSTHRNRFEISLSNLGNTEHTLQLAGGDPEDACTYEFEQERVTIGPGQQKEVTVEVRPVSSPVVSGSKLIGFSVHARSVEVPSAVASGQAQLERRSFLSPANLGVLAILLLICAAWYLMRPKPPTVEMQVTPMSGLAGETVVVSWIAHDADQVRINIDGPKGSTEVYKGSDLSSSIQLKLVGPPGIEHIVAEASKGGNRSLPSTRQIQINAPPELVTPKIVSFGPVPGTVTSGKSDEIRIKAPGDVVFQWNVEGAVKLALTPDFSDLDPTIVDSKSVHFESAGERTFQLVAVSKDGITVRSEKKFRVIAYDESDAKIVEFSAFPTTVQGSGIVSLTWNVVNATPNSIAIKHDGIVDSSLPINGNKSYTISKDTAFTLEALDGKSRPAAPAKIWIKVVPLPTTEPTTSGPTDGTGTTGISPITPPATGSTNGGNDSGTTTTGR